MALSKQPPSSGGITRKVTGPKFCGGVGAEDGSTGGDVGGVSSGVGIGEGGARAVTVVESKRVLQGLFAKRLIL